MQLPSLFSPALFSPLSYFIKFSLFFVFNLPLPFLFISHPLYFLSIITFISPSSFVCTFPLSSPSSLKVSLFHIFCSRPFSQRVLFILCVVSSPRASVRSPLFFLQYSTSFLFIFRFIFESVLIFISLMLDFFHIFIFTLLKCCLFQHFPYLLCNQNWPFAFVLIFASI